MVKQSGVQAKKLEPKAEAKVETTRIASLPEELNGVEAMSPEVQSKLVQDFVAKQRERFERSLKAKAEGLAQRLTEKDGLHKQIIVRKILLQQLKAQVAERRATIKVLRKEVRAMKVEARAKAKAAKVVVTAPPAAEPTKA